MGILNVLTLLPLTLATLISGIISDNADPSVSTPCNASQNKRVVGECPMPIGSPYLQPNGHGVSDGKGNVFEIKEEIYQPKAHVSKNAYIKSMAEYKKMYAKSIEDPVEFWSEIAKQFHWQAPIDKHRFWSYNFDVTKGPVFIKWLDGATTNICYNLLDRNIKLGLGNKIAFYWEGNNPKDYRRLTYYQLKEQVCKFANILKSKGVGKGDRVAIYMPMILETIVVILACSRIGAVHSIVFAGFSADSLADRLVDSKCKILVTAESVYRGKKLLNLKKICDTGMDRAKNQGHEVKTCIVVRHVQRLTSNLESTNKPENGVNESSTNLHEVSWNKDRDVWWHEEMKGANSSFQPVWVSTEDPLFILHTSGSTGKPKGVLHTVGGYLLYAATTFKYVFDYKPDDVYWCTADVGWITGHTYGVYGPLANGATSIIFEGTPFHPAVDRFWSIIQKYKVNQFYTAPTVVRALMKFGNEHPDKYDLSTLRVLGSVGEPINPEAWLWYYKVIGKENCSIADTFWQTETGGHVITPLPGCTPMKPGSASFPFFGVEPALLDENGTKIEGEGEGYLVFDKPWPGMMRSLFGNHKRFEETYFSKFPGYYCTGDGARRDSDGYLFITGRIDDKLNVCGHLLSTAEVESCLTEHPAVSEAAVVSRPHPIKGECLYCFVTPNQGVEFGQQLVKELNTKVSEKIGPFAIPDVIQYAPGLPKTRSGKIMRRILRKIAVNDKNVGDTSTLADEGIVEILFKNRPESSW